MEQIKNILVIRTDQLGDVLLTIPILTAFKKQYPEIKLNLVTQKQFALFLQKQTCIDTIIPFEKTFFGRIKLLLNLFHRKYDLVVDAVTKSDIFSSLCIFFANSTQKRGFNVGLRKYFLSQKIKPPEKLTHETRMIKLLFPEITKPLKLFSKNHKNQLGIISISPFASESVKEWPLENWRECLTKLTALSDYEVHIFGLPKHKNILDKLVMPKVFLNTNISLMQFYEFLKNSALHLTVNNGAMHLAAMAGVPQIVLNGPSSIIRWKPLQKKVTILSSNLDCVQSEGKYGSFTPCIKNNGACMKAISVDQVVDAVKKEQSF